MINMKICNCGYETEKTSFKFCPLCGKPLNILEMESDGTYKAEREACRVINDWLSPNTIFYFKRSPIDNTLVWIYETPTSNHFILGCHISKVKPLKLENVERCVLRKDGICGKSASCSLCYPKLKQKYSYWFS